MASNYNKIFYYTEESNILTIKKVKYLKNKKNYWNIKIQNSNKRWQNIQFKQSVAKNRKKLKVIKKYTKEKINKKYKTKNKQKKHKKFLL